MDLSAFRDVRLLLIFTPSATTPEYAEQQRIVETNAAGFTDRNLLTIGLFEAENNAPESPISPEEAAVFREQYGIEKGRFAVVLVGKDGGEKFRSGKPVPARELFGRIDAMPMRRREMRRKMREE
ncbi:MAG: DUF4174 domain-containing protein [Rubrobacteraceae bacterium]